MCCSMWVTEVTLLNKERMKARIVRIKHEHPDEEDMVQSNAGGD